MLLIRELGRTVRDIVAFAMSSRRLGLLFLVVAVAAIVALAGAVTVVAPVALYPLL